jgi:hypothetical protein
MPRIEFDLNSELPAERIRAALTDFTDRRPDLWPGLNRTEYRVYEVGETSAEIREGSGGSVWARERYDWSKPDRVTWTVVESGFSAPGSFVSAIITPRQGGGSHIHVIWNRRGVNTVGRLIIGLIALTRGWPVKRSIAAGLRAIAAHPSDR